MHETSNLVRVYRSRFNAAEARKESLASGAGQVLLGHHHVEKDNRCLRYLMTCQGYGVGVG